MLLHDLTQESHERLLGPDTKAQISASLTKLLCHTSPRADNAAGRSR